MSEFFEQNLQAEMDIQIPPKCEGCGVQCDLAQKLVGLIMKKNLGLQVGEQLIGDVPIFGLGEDQELEQIEELGIENIEELKSGIRKLVGDGLDNIDDEIDSLNAEINANAIACDGVLKMRASKGDVTYTVSVCTSPRVYMRDSDYPEHISAHVKTQSNYR